MNKETEIGNFAIAILKPDTGKDILTLCLINEIESQGGIVIK